MKMPVIEQLRSATILIADDDPDDRMLMREALQESELSGDVRFVMDGEELMEYLNHCGKYADPGSAPRPGLILLDLNMPRKDGREVLKEIDLDPSLRRIPIVVLTTSKSEEDIDHSYQLGANSYITKPVTFQALVEITRELGRYWFDTVALPACCHEKSY
jgi:two-component system, response regulator